MKIQLFAILAFAPALFAQFPGGPPPGPPKPAKAIAPIDLTGYWVSIVTEDWRFRMIAAPKGDFAGVPSESGRPEDRQRMGSGQGRSRRQSVQGLRRGRSDAHSHAPAHHLAGRQHAQDRNRCRDANALVALRPAADTQRSSDLARLFGALNGTDRPAVSDISERLSIPPRAARSK